jgi:osmotically inducible protein OsmC
MAIDRKATATWSGTGKEGSGNVSTTSGVLKNTQHSFTTRFVSEDGREGTNPEELIAAAHASCFTMKLSFVLNAAGHTADLLSCTAHVRLDKVGEGMGVVGIHLDLTGTVPGITEAEFMAMAEAAKVGCPISQLLKSVPITLNAHLAVS